MTATKSDLEDLRRPASGEKTGKEYATQDASIVDVTTTMLTRKAIRQESKMLKENHIIALIIHQHTLHAS